MTEATFRRAYAVHPIAALQVEYSLFFLDIEEEKIGLNACRELGIAVVVYSPLGRGMLTGAYVSPTPNTVSIQCKSFKNTENTGRQKSHDDMSDGERRKTIPK